MKAFGGRIRFLGIGGAKLHIDTETFLYEGGFPYAIGYGLTETAPMAAGQIPGTCRIGATGPAMSGVDIRLDNVNPATGLGEVVINSPSVMQGYYKNPEATAAVFTEDGWFRTGDIGILDEDGYLFLRGRSKCMILGPSGQNIYPEEIEYSINNLPYVVDSLVIDDNGTLCALIFPDYAAAEKDGMDAAAVKEKIASFLPTLNKQLPSYSKIKKIECRGEDFERTPKKSIRRYLYQKS
jgi:long-chain acyl-CoA synthetase